MLRIDKLKAAISYTRASDVANEGKVPPLTVKKLPKRGKKSGKRGKLGKKRQKSERFFHFAPPNR